MSTQGHNSIAHDQLRNVVQRIEKLEEEKADLAVDIREVYAEAKGGGLDVKTLRTLIRRRKIDASARDEQDQLLELYEGVFA